MSTPPNLISIAFMCSFFYNRPRKKFLFVKKHEKNIKKNKAKIKKYKDKFLIKDCVVLSGAALGMLIFHSSSNKISKKFRKYSKKFQLQQSLHNWKW